MGSSASKGARAAGAAGRKYPARASGATTRAPAPPPAQPPRPGRGLSPSGHPPPQGSETKTQAIDPDARDAAFASRLSTMGAVQPNPHYSATSTSEFDPQPNTSHHLPPDAVQAPPQAALADLRDNPALRVLEARQRIQDEAERELEGVGRRGFGGRKYVDASTIQLALMRRRHGQHDDNIEAGLGIQKGRLGALGNRVVEAV